MIWAVGFISWSLLADTEAEGKPTGSTAVVGVQMSASRVPKTLGETPRPPHKSTGFSSGPD